MPAHTAGTPTRTGPRRAAGGPLIGVQVTAVLSVLVLAWQFVTAGALLPRGGPIGLHATGAIVLHVVLGLLTVAAVLWARSARGPWWPAVVAAVVFVLSFLQAYAGEHGILTLHVPCAMLLTLGTVWVTAWSFGPGARTRTGQEVG
jgi:hypothetical protein